MRSSGLALGDSEDGKAVTIRARRCSLLCLQKAKQEVTGLCGGGEGRLCSSATRSTLRACMYDELASVTTVNLSRTLRM